MYCLTRHLKKKNILNGVFIPPLPNQELPGGNQIIPFAHLEKVHAGWQVSPVKTGCIAFKRFL